MLACCEGLGNICVVHAACFVDVVRVIVVHVLGWLAEAMNCT